MRHALFFSTFFDSIPHFFSLLPCVFIVQIVERKIIIASFQIAVKYVEQEIDILIFTLYNILNRIGERKDVIMKLSDIVKNYRAKNNLSVSEMAKRSDLSKGYISMIERGVNPRTNTPISPTLNTLNKLSRGMNVELEELLNRMDPEESINLVDRLFVMGNVKTYSDKKNQQDLHVKEGQHRIPVLGRVAAGIPIEMVEDVIDWEEIDDATAKLGAIFALSIKGDSMEPRIVSGDVVIVRQQDDAESGDIVIVSVNGDDATCKRLRKYKDGVELVPSNSSYSPIFFSNEEIVTKPVKILGKVIELRGKM